MDKMLDTIQFYTTIIHGEHRGNGIINNYDEIYMVLHMNLNTETIIYTQTLL